MENNIAKGISLILAIILATIVQLLTNHMDKKKKEWMKKEDERLKKMAKEILKGDNHERF